MTDREIRHLSKPELLSIIRDQEQELGQMKEQAAKLRQQLDDKKISLEKCDSIAEASLQINGVFASAQAAANQYLAEVRERRDGINAETGHLLDEARQKADAQIRASMETGRKLEEESRRKADAYWNSLSEKLEAFYAGHQGLKEMLDSCGMDVQIPNTGVKRGNDLSESTASKP